MAEIRLGRFAGLAVSAVPSAIAGSLVLWAFYGFLGAWFFHADTLEAVPGGLALMMLYWLSELLHQSGHAAAARSVGKPMTGVRFYLTLGMSLYPENEGAVTPDQHLRRAVGGPIRSAVVTLITGAIAAVMAFLHVPGAWVAVLYAVSNLLVFTLGALLPLGFNDGSSIIRALRARRTAAG
jgi:Zn-dependent protease